MDIKSGKNKHKVIKLMEEDESVLQPNNYQEKIKKELEEQKTKEAIKTAIILGFVLIIVILFILYR